MAGKSPFPLELEREIFEIIAITYPAFIPALLRVCHRVRIWIEPLLYRVLVLPSLQDHRPLLSAIESKTPAFLHSTVQHVLLSSCVSDKGIEGYRNLFSKCSGILNLSLGIELDSDIISSLNKLRLQKLALTVPSIFSAWNLASFTHPFFRSITHLDLFGDSSHPSTDGPNDLCEIASLPALTHLALSRQLADDCLSRIAAECPRLVLMVVVTYSRKGAAFLAEKLAVEDPRVVVMAVGVRYRSDWTLGAWGGHDFWVRAAAFVARKRAGQTQGYLLDEPAPESSQ